MLHCVEMLLGRDSYAFALRPTLPFPYKNQLAPIIPAHTQKPGVVGLRNTFKINTYKTPPGAANTYAKNNRGI
jgi:hypothetical protein